MKTLKHLTRYLGCALAICALLLCSCTSDRQKLLETVPFDAEFVSTVNLVKLASESGITIEDGRLVLPQEYASLKEAIKPEDLKLAGQLAEAIDLENVVVFGYIQRETLYATATVRDADALRLLLKNKDMEREHENGLDIYATSSSDYADCVVLSDDGTQMWFVENRRNASNVTEFITSTKKNNIMRYSGLAETLTSDNIANIVLDHTTLNTGLDGYWAAVNFNVDNNAIVVEGKNIANDGAVYTSDMFQPVNTDFLRYMPANFICAMAFGVNPDGGWSKTVGNMVNQTLSGSDRAAADEVMPYIKAIDGTVAFGFGPKSKSSLLDPMSPQQWQALLMAHLNQSKVNDLTETMRSMFPGSQSTGNGIYHFNSQDLDLYYGNLDGYFTVAMGLPLNPDKSNSFTNDFNGKPLAAVLQTPLLGSIVDDSRLDFSIKTSLMMNESTVRLQINLVGTESPIIPTLVTSLPVFAEKYQRIVRDR